MDLSIIEIMKSEVCHNHKSNCDLCPIMEQCKNGVIDQLQEETSYKFFVAVEVDTQSDTEMPEGWEDFNRMMNEAYSEYEDNERI